MSQHMPEHVARTTKTTANTLQPRKAYKEKTTIAVAAIAAPLNFPPPQQRRQPHHPSLVEPVGPWVRPMGPVVVEPVDGKWKGTGWAHALNWTLLGFSDISGSPKRVCKCVHVYIYIYLYNTVYHMGKMSRLVVKEILH